MSSLETTITELIPDLYKERAEILGRPAWVDQSHSNQCQPLTFDLMIALQNRGFPVRRELHKDDNGNWHYILAHADSNSIPSDNDMMTDVNPWQWTADMKYKGPLHATREDVMAALERAGAPDYFIALRSLETIVKSHEPQK